MKLLSYLLMIGIGVWSIQTKAEELKPMKIKLSIGNNIVLVNLVNNAATEQLAAMLPDEFEFRDFAGQEKISYFPQKVSLKNVQGGMIARKGKMFIYAPWGNFGFFYKNVGNTPDSALIELGTIESGLEYLQNQPDNFTAKMEIVE